MAKTDHLRYIRDRIDDIDGVSFGDLPKLFDDIATACDKAIKERDALAAVLQNNQASGD
jgi:hypothetical protein